MDLCFCCIVLSVPCSLVVTCWKRSDVLALLYVMFSLVFVTFPYGILGQVWYLIVSIPDLCRLPYVAAQMIFQTPKQKNLYINSIYVVNCAFCIFCIHVTVINKCSSTYTVCLETALQSVDRCCTVRVLVPNHKFTIVGYVLT